MVGNGAADEAGNSEGSGALATLFGLSVDEAALAEAFCREALADQGINGGALFKRLGRGEGLAGALGLTPAILDALYARAHRWFAVGHPEKAEPLFRVLCVVDPALADYWTGHGICLRLLNQIEAARMAFQTAARLRPDWSVPAFHLCELSILRGDIGAASDHLARFKASADAQTPAQMRTEAARFERAIEFRHGG